MIPNIIPINAGSTVEDIDDNFKAIQEAITDKQLSFHYLNLYNLKGSVIGTASAITIAYNLLNLNEALLIVNSSTLWRDLTLNIGDYVVKTTAGPLRIPGPTTGYYNPSFSGTALTFTYTTIEPLDGTEVTQDIQGASGSGYDLIHSLAVDTDWNFPATYNSENTIIRPIIQIYDDYMLIDYPYSLTLAGSAPDQVYTLKLTTENEWTGKTFTVRVR